MRGEMHRVRAHKAEPEEWAALGLPRSEVVISPMSAKSSAAPPKSSTKTSPTSKKRTGKAKKTAAPKKDQAWFERQVAELKAELEKLPAHRQEQFRRELNEERKGGKKTAG